MTIDRKGILYHDRHSSFSSAISSLSFFSVFKIKANKKANSANNGNWLFSLLINLLVIGQLPSTGWKSTGHGNLCAKGHSSIFAMSKELENPVSTADRVGGGQ